MRGWGSTIRVGHPIRRSCDIEVLENQRGSGNGRALLREVESAVRNAGIGAMELNVFGRNTAAVRLYESSGYGVTTQQMRKQL